VLHVLICEDDLRQRAHIASIVTKHISTEEAEMELVLSSGNPTEVLTYLEKHPDKRGLYFLDIDLQDDEINGIDLGVKIMEVDPYAKIVFITTHSELAHLTYEYRIGAMDFIVKNRPEGIERRTIECLLAAYKRYLEEKSELMKYFKVDANGEVWSIPHDDILFFETHSRIRHRIILHTETGKMEFRGFLSEVEKLVPEFYRCHKSYLLNVKKITYIDKLTKEAVMPNEKRVHIAVKKMSELVGLMNW